MDGGNRQITVGRSGELIARSSHLQVLTGAALADQPAACCPSRQSILGWKRHQHRGCLRSLYFPTPKGWIRT